MNEHIKPLTTDELVEDLKQMNRKAYWELDGRGEQYTSIYLQLWEDYLNEREKNES